MVLCLLGTIFRYNQKLKVMNLLCSKNLVVKDSDGMLIMAKDVVKVEKCTTGSRYLATILISRFALEGSAVVLSAEVIAEHFEYLEYTQYLMLVMSRK